MIGLAGIAVSVATSFGVSDAKTGVKVKSASNVNIVVEVIMGVSVIVSIGVSVIETVDVWFASIIGVNVVSICCV